jgi:hypothetical protein
MNNNNIHFFLNDNDNIKNNEDNIIKMMDELNNDELYSLSHGSFVLNDDYEYLNNENMIYFINKSTYNDDETFYNEEYNVKELLKICSYYGIDKNIKSSKCKKQDIISTIIYFESLLENANIVNKRHRMWSYVTELQNDPKMKKYLLF